MPNLQKSFQGLNIVSSETTQAEVGLADHIQKNAGSLLETLALEANISWGVCHFDFPWRSKSEYRKCPLLRDTNVMSSGVWWHYPLQFLNDMYPFKNNESRLDPYDNSHNTSYMARPKSLVSFFNHNHRGNRAKARTMGLGSKAYMNRWVQNLLQNGKNVGLMWTNSTICQHQYLVDERTNTPIPDVDHVVQFEYLAQDFNPLANKYGLNLAIPEHKNNANDYANADTLTWMDLSRDSLAMLNRLCPQDFELGRGYQLFWTPPNQTIKEW